MSTPGQHHCLSKEAMGTQMDSFEAQPQISAAHYNHGEGSHYPGLHAAYQLRPKHYGVSEPFQTNYNLQAEFVPSDTVQKHLTIPVPSSLSDNQNNQPMTQVYHQTLMQPPNQQEPFGIQSYPQSQCTDLQGYGTQFFTGEHNCMLGRKHSSSNESESSFPSHNKGHSRKSSTNTSLSDYPEPIKPKVATTFWEDENTICYQVKARGVMVSRREDTGFVNGTKLLNVIGMTRGKRDGMLKTEKVRNVVKVGSMNLKGVWIPLERAHEIARNEGLDGALYPLFVKDLRNYYKSVGHKLKDQYSEISPTSKEKLEMSYSNTGDSSTAKLESNLRSEHFLFGKFENEKVNNFIGADEAKSPLD